MNSMVAIFQIGYQYIATIFLNVMIHYLVTYPDKSEVEIAQMIVNNPAEVSQYLMFMVGGLFLFVFSIVALRWNLRLPVELKGRKLGVIASLLSVSGFIFGFAPIITTIHSVTVAILFFIAVYQMNQYELVE